MPLYPAQSGAYVATADLVSTWISPGEMSGVTGSPALSQTGGTAWPSWKLDAAAIEIVAVTVDKGRMPGWATMNVDLWWTTDSGAGDVVWRLDYVTPRADGDAYGTGATVGTPVTVTAPANTNIKVTTLASGLAVPDTAKILLLKVIRLATDVADTLANDANIFGVRLGKA